MAVESHKIKDKIIDYLKGSVIEIGCGDETIIDGVFGVDGRKFPCVNFVTDNLYDLPIQLLSRVNSFDCCFSSHTLEHLPDSYRCIIEWSEFVKPNGYFVLYLPDGEYYDNYENREHFHDTTYKQFLFWFKRTFCGEALNFKGEQYQKPLFELIEHGQDVGDNRYSFYLVAKKIG